MVRVFKRGSSQKGLVTLKGFKGSRLKGYNRSTLNIILIRIRDVRQIYWGNGFITRINAGSI